MEFIIVESPTKASTFNRYLKGKNYQVEATFGQIRDLPANKFAVDVETDFKPQYILVKRKKDPIKKIKSLAKKASSIILATDSDREGESIAYHIAYILGFARENWPDFQILPNGKLKRIVFHEITKKAVQEALKKPESLNIDLLKAQQARRILDRIVGYKLSPLLWKKMGKRWLSAGRVQTVALRLIVEREKEIEKFKPETFYKSEVVFKDGGEIEATLIGKDDQSYEEKVTLKLFDGNYTYTKTSIGKKTAAKIKEELKRDNFFVLAVDEKSYKRFPPPPFLTSTLQQEAFRAFGFSAKLTISLAQTLYEKGFITYHRTDSLNLSNNFLRQAKKYLAAKFGKNYSLAKPRVYKKKSKLAQEAHEAIRPTRLVDKISTKEKKITANHQRLYQLIFNRAVASQMKEAELKSIKIKIISKKGYLFQSGWSQVIFDGFLKIFGQKKEQKKYFQPNKGESVNLKKIVFSEQITSPPPRYNEASLIKALESKGIGRPSTYAPIVSTIQDRNYSVKKSGRFEPTTLGTSVCNYLVSAFPDIFDIFFTAKMEDELDSIAQGEKSMIKTLHSFYKPFSISLVREEEKKEFIDVEEETEEVCPRCAHDLVIRFSKFGKFYACSNFPKCKFTKPHYEVIDKKCPQCGGQMLVKYTKKRKKFYGCSNYPKCNFASWRLSQIERKKADYG